MAQLSSAPVEMLQWHGPGRGLRIVAITGPANAPAGRQATTLRRCRSVMQGCRLSQRAPTDSCEEVAPALPHGRCSSLSSLHHGLPVYHLSSPSPQTLCASPTGRSSQSWSIALPFQCRGHERRVCGRLRYLKEFSPEQWRCELRTRHSAPASQDRWRPRRQQLAPIRA